MQVNGTVKSICKMLGLAVMLAASIGPAQAESVQFEYKLKAVFLLNFAKFVQWPANAFAGDTGPLTICVIGDDPFESVLDQVVQGETVKNHPLAVARPTVDRDYRACHIAFFSRSVEPHVATLLAKQTTPHILTVGDNESFIRQGGMINFLLEDTKVRFVVNSSALEKANFEVSSKLLSLGRPASQ